jgi:glycine C-acetyltransferase
MIPTATHTLEDVSETIEAFSGMRDKLEKGVYKRIAAAMM